MKDVNVRVGVADFRKVREGNYYYIDKTGLIEEILRTPGTEVTLITRPRRFGKSLGMSMLEHFFDMGEQMNSAIKRGLGENLNPFFIAKFRCF